MEVSIELVITKIDTITHYFLSNCIMLIFVMLLNTELITIRNI